MSLSTSIENCQEPKVGIARICDLENVIQEKDVHTLVFLTVFWYKCLNDELKK